MGLQQGSWSVYDYVIEFHMLAASGWDDDALFDAFLIGLSDAVKDELVSRDLPQDLPGLVDLAGHVDAIGDGSSEAEDGCGVVDSLLKAQPSTLPGVRKLWFIRDYSFVARSLTALTSTKLPFCWSEEAEDAFTDLKQRFT